MKFKFEKCCYILTKVHALRDAKSDGNLTGNERFEGFCIDLLRTIAELLGFNYDLYLVPDNKFGAENTTSGEWSGLVKEIIEKVFFLSCTNGG
ncbi:hypothetical protein CEXT_717361 [Caerostris extrusa]|uniref:Ionotropic glutamate receptor L-glutamate and glycine-binding domain-containing protein n=1 Tax=Caerostris extrusa TaxID=172846 RepID=A0AAV4Y4K1_CAEEX|nr:hypothetical protein CEXT_717361 [Caerostris extrusa]